MLCIYVWCAPSWALPTKNPLLLMASMENYFFSSKNGNFFCVLCAGYTSIHLWLFPVHGRTYRWYNQSQWELDRQTDEHAPCFCDWIRKIRKLVCNGRLRQVNITTTSAAATTAPYQRHHRRILLHTNLFITFFFLTSSDSPFNHIITPPLVDWDRSTGLAQSKTTTASFDREKKVKVRLLPASHR